MAATQRKVVDFKMLLSLAHAKGLESILTDAVTVTPDFAFFKAIVTMRDGGVFNGHADATPKNVGPGIAPSFIRMAETRAIVRALRLAVNVGEVGIEELADYEHQSGRAESVPAGATPINDSGHQCTHKECNAPAGKRHASKCPVTLQAAPAGM